MQYRNALLNVIENKKPDEWIGSQSVPATYLIKDKKVLQKFDGTVDMQELKDAILKYK